MGVGEDAPRSDDIGGATRLSDLDLGLPEVLRRLLSSWSELQDVKFNFSAAQVVAVDVEDVYYTTPLSHDERVAVIGLLVDSEEEEEVRRRMRGKTEPWDAVSLAVDKMARQAGGNID